MAFKTLDHGDVDIKSLKGCSFNNVHDFVTPEYAMKGGATFDHCSHAMTVEITEVMMVLAEGIDAGKLHMNVLSDNTLADFREAYDNCVNKLGLNRNGMLRKMLLSFPDVFQVVAGTMSRSPGIVVWKVIPDR